jgi:outer membrane receptor for ferrienterochelin and colicins
MSNGQSHSLQADSSGHFTALLNEEVYLLKVHATGYQLRSLKIAPPFHTLSVDLLPEGADLGNVVVTGAMREQSKDESAINIDVITPAMFRKTAVPNLFEAAGLINGVRPQINCNVCSTGDIHINGLEGPYTLILIDGMPIVSGLSTVYGLMGIPQGMIERLEIAKGPASALYGSEAMAGTINLITRKPSSAPRVFAEHLATAYQEHNFSLSVKNKWRGEAANLLGVNVFYFDTPIDRNKDGFTDLTLQKRISVFDKIGDERNSLAGRWVYEDRWGGQTGWSKIFRGGDSLYGESIYTNRLELIGKYAWEKVKGLQTQLSYNLHDQDACYGLTSFTARQSTAFLQTYFNKQLQNHFLLYGAAIKQLWYDDNTIVTPHPELTWLPGVFFQDEWQLDTAEKQVLLSGVRFDYSQRHGIIPSPRFAWKYTPHYRLTLRVNVATGFRVVNVFTEDHAALTGSRKVVFTEAIQPERSLNGSFNLVWKMKLNATSILTWDASLFYYHFFNRITANYDVDPNAIVYANLHGYGFSRGLALNLSLVTTGPFKLQSGITISDVQNVATDSIKVYSRQVHSPLFSGNFQMSYEYTKKDLRIDVIGNWYGPQRLPIQRNDFRPEYSPWYTLMDAQITKSFGKKVEAVVGVKNIFNFVPSNPLMRPFDPFDKKVNDVVSNPYGYTFDTGYNYAPLQGIKPYLTLRYTLK